MITHGGLRAEDRSRVIELLASIDAFTDAERAVALELVDTRLGNPHADDYRFILAFDAPSPSLAGYLCYGRTPMTERTYDLYWLATSPSHARTGVARGLVERMEAEITAAGGGLVRVETGSREGHGAAVQFYDAVGYVRAATLDDFYAQGDDLIVFTRRVDAAGAGARASAAARSASDGAAAELGEAALYDAAFEHRDYAAERDFLLACAARFGGRDVRRVLAWASGCGRHLLAFADVGVEGRGVDASPALVAYASHLLVERAHSAAPWVDRKPHPTVSATLGALDPEPSLVGASAGDGADRVATASSTAVDLSFVPLSSIHQLASEDAIVRHLEAAAACLAPGGVHVIEATHPGDLLPTGVHHTEWTAVRGDLVIDARFRMHIDRRVGSLVPVTLDVVCAGDKRASPRGRLRQEDRWFIPDAATWRRVVARVPAFQLKAALGDFRVDVPFEHAAAWRLILVLRRV